MLRLVINLFCHMQRSIVNDSGLQLDASLNVKDTDDEEDVSSIFQFLASFCRHSLFAKFFTRTMLNLMLSQELLQVSFLSCNHHCLPIQTPKFQKKWEKINIRERKVQSCDRQSRDKLSSLKLLKSEILSQEIKCF